MRRCFVISPIGAEGSAVREHADDVFDFIIRPAMEECGITVVRADHLKEPGKISTQMFAEILRDDLCIALLTGANPNVYYELAVAQCARKPVVILIEKGQTLPFDVRDWRCVAYDLKPRALHDKTYVREVVEHVRALERAEWSAPGIIDGSVGRSRETLHATSESFGTSEDWSRLLEGTQRQFDLMGISLSSWKKGKGFARALAEKARQGCAVRVLLMDEDNPALVGLLNPSVPEEDPVGVRLRIREMWEYFTKIAGAAPGIEVRRIRVGGPHVQLARADQRAVFVQYLYSASTHHSPLWDCDAASPLYRTMTQEFDALWETNAPRA